MNSPPFCTSFNDIFLKYIENECKQWKTFVTSACNRLRKSATANSNVDETVSFVYGRNPRSFLFPSIPNVTILQVGIKILIIPKVLCLSSGFHFGSEK